MSVARVEGFVFVVGGQRSVGPGGLVEKDCARLDPPGRPHPVLVGAEGGLLGPGGKDGVLPALTLKQCTEFRINFNGTRTRALRSTFCSAKIVLTSDMTLHPITFTNRKLSILFH